MPNQNPPKSPTPAASLASIPSIPPQATYALIVDANFAPATVYDAHMNPLEAYLSNVEVPTSVFTLATINEEVPTYTDSGATDYCFVKQSNFEEYKAYGMPQQGVSANRGGVFNILEEGTVKRTTTINGHTSKLIFRLALHMPDLAANLVSIRKFNDLGFSVTFAGGKASFTDPAGHTFMTGEKKHQMYRLELCSSSTGLPPAHPLSYALSGGQDLQKTPTKVLVAPSLDKPVSLNVWHQRFSHANLQSIRKLESKQLVDGLHVRGLVSAPGMCKDCIYGKQTIWPYNGTSEDIRTAGEKVYIDF